MFATTPAANQFVSAITVLYDCFNEFRASANENGVSGRVGGITDIGRGTAFVNSDGTCTGTITFSGYMIELVNTDGNLTNSFEEDSGTGSFSCDAVSYDGSKLISVAEQSNGNDASSIIIGAKENFLN